MREFNLKDVQDMLADLDRLQPKTMPPVAFAMSQEAYDSLWNEFEKWPSKVKRPTEVGRTELCGIRVDVKPGQKVPCWAFYNLQVFRSYLDPRVPPASLETLQKLREYES